MASTGTTQGANGPDGSGHGTTHRPHPGPKGAAKVPKTGAK